MKKFLIIDLFNLIHRAYHAIPKEFTDKDGNPTNAIYGVCSMLINVLQQVKPDYVCAVVDSEKPTFRHVDFTGYKAHRRPTEDLLTVQIPKIKEFIQMFGISTVTSPGYEADDLAGTLAVKNQKGIQVILLSNDRDLWQLVNNNIMIMLPSTKGEKIDWLGEKEVEARLGVLPSKVPDYKGLVGDPSDNIPGVYGIGGKGAQNLINKFGSIEEIYKNIDKVEPESLRKKLVDGYDQAVMSKKLATLDLETPAEFEFSDAVYKSIPMETIAPVLERYNFKSLLKRLGVDLDNKEELSPQKGLFD